MGIYRGLDKIYKQSDLFAALKAYDIWLFLAWLDIKLRYRRSKIGPLWITLSMAIFCLTLGVVYSKLLKTDISEYLPFLSVSFVIWGLISSLLIEFPNLYVDNAAYIKDIHINFYTVLFRVVARNAVVFGHNALIILGIYIYFDLWPGFTFLLAIPGLGLVLLNLVSIGVILSIFGARYRDVAQINQSLVQVLFFISPVLWFPRLVPQDSWILIANPFAYFLDLIRSPLLGSTPALASWGVAIGTLILLSIVAAFLYRTKSSRIPFWV
ncbi:ABC transporter permease [Nitrosospira multiformis]|uniref:ABC-2 type transport system permease protein/lipopolysaccharide transport system permease protein n=1 Tax=Nitrosospira multiformis TaxID=1231 RepID=A0A1I7I769_9PROT|nr:ABC transporter permease [Nitrosospira multiformis]SFU68825.1 ABC-2 type transport system permease protein/lipopolysaccharide transport system permease protein [Nitrosospira multiformis]